MTPFSAAYVVFRRTVGVGLDWTGLGWYQGETLWVWTGLISRWDTLQVSAGHTMSTVCWRLASAVLCYQCLQAAHCGRPRHISCSWTVSAFWHCAVFGSTSGHLNVTLSAIFPYFPHPKPLPVATSSCHSVCNLWLKEMSLKCVLYLVFWLTVCLVCRSAVWCLV